ncbi:hypothetical protein Q6247_25430, partial [Klebsiella pneumoniae]
DRSPSSPACDLRCVVSSSIASGGGRFCRAAGNGGGSGTDCECRPDSLTHSILRPPKRTHCVFLNAAALHGTTQFQTRLLRVAIFSLEIGTPLIGVVLVPD